MDGLIWSTPNLARLDGYPDVKVVYRTLVLKVVGIFSVTFVKCMFKAFSDLFFWEIQVIYE